MRVAFHDSDITDFPNLALLKLAAWHKSQGDTVEIFYPLNKYDMVYSSKVFTWTPESPYLPPDTIKGGTGYNLNTALPESIEHFCPDYGFAGMNYSMGFLTRGCIRSCPWCVVPEKEGAIRPHADIEEFARHNKVKLLDNNVLAHDHGIQQIEKIARLSLRVDFNQGLDARLIDKPMAKLLATVKWWKPVRLACDHINQLPIIIKAVTLLRKFGVTPSAYFIYVLAKNVEDALFRAKCLDALGADPFVQPYRDPASTDEPGQELRHLARYVNHKAIFRSTTWEDYKYNQATARAAEGCL